MKTFKANSGMTLLEVLMVTALLAFVALAIFTTLRSMVDAKKSVDAKSESTQEFRAILGLMTRDIQTAFFNTAEDFIWNPIEKPIDPNTGLKPAEAQRPAPITIFFGKENEIFLSSRSHQRLAANTPENEEHFVTYQLQDSKLIRAESPRAVNMYDRQDPTKFKSTVLLDRVSSLKFKYYDPKTGNWVDTWDTESAGYRDRLPGAVEIEFTITPHLVAGEKRTERQKDIKVSTAVTITNVIMGQGSAK